MGTAKRITAGGLAFFGALTIGFVVYLMFYFPQVQMIWADQGRELVLWERFLVNASGMCRSYALAVIPLLVLLVISLFVVAVQSERES